MNAPDMLLSPSHDTAPPARRAFAVDELDIFRTARTDVCVLFTGRARADMAALQIHNLSGWRWGRFVSIDCGWSDQILEKSLFGLLESDTAAPDTTAVRPRLLQAGTLFLHEVGKLSLSHQRRLADALESASAHGRRGRWRVMASASQPLLERVVDGTFDDRLYYRLNAIHLVVER